MATITKADIAEYCSNKISLKDNNLNSLKIVESIFEEIRLCLEKGEEIKITGFGKFTLNNKDARPGRNPKTGKYAEISARRVVTFKASQKLKKSLNCLEQDDNYKS